MSLCAVGVWSKQQFDLAQQYIKKRDACKAAQLFSGENQACAPN